MAKIAVILPSRGLMFSQTAEELLENLEGYDYDIYFAHGLPIPDCFNKPLTEALKGTYTHFWFVEDDMVLPKDTLKRLLQAKTEAICCDYPVTKGGKASVYRDPEGNAIYGGTGCLLVTSRFLQKYRQPIFRTDIAWDVKIGDRFEAESRKIKGNVYGLHDVTFGLLAYQRGTPIKVSKITCGQRKLIALGKAGTNQGQHNIEVWTKLIPEGLTPKKLKTRNVLFNDGTLALVDFQRANKLVEEGKATIPHPTWVELVDNDVLGGLL